jgi:hypothetical protein
MLWAADSVARSSRDHKTAFEKALHQGVAAAQGLGGRAEAAVWVDGWSKPVVVGGGEQMRLWSTAKPLTALTVMVVAQKSHIDVDKGFAEWMAAAFKRSENCPQREMELYLQQLMGMQPSNNSVLARAPVKAIKNVLTQAAIRDAVVPNTTQPFDGSCSSASHRFQRLPLALTQYALQLGTMTWTIRDAVKFAHALANGVYDRHGRRVLDLMRARKAPNREFLNGSDSSARLEWGAGNVFRGWKPAYKAGWGGRNDDEFMVVQYVVLRVYGHDIAAAAAFHPSTQPIFDDPRQLNASRAIEAMFGPLRAAIERVLRWVKKPTSVCQAAACRATAPAPPSEARTRGTRWCRTVIEFPDDSKHRPGWRLDRARCL